MPRRIAPRKPVPVHLAPWRERMGLTQQQVGDHIRPPVDKATVSRWETMKRAPSLDVLAAYAEALGIPVINLYRLPAEEENLAELIARSPREVRRTIRATVEAIIKSSGG